MFGSTWGTNNAQNQQQQQPNAFGQPSGFGAGAFGSTPSAFGQPQQQPQANPMFGGAAPTNTATTGAFGSGGFGTTNAANTGGIFGSQPKPATGFGAFGGTGAFGSTPATGTSTFGGGGGAFGSTGGANTGTGTGLFGAQASTSTSGAFGGGGLFGAKPSTGFGATPASGDGTAPVTTGSANPAFSAFTEKDGVNSSITLQYQSITAMPAYRGSSFEELRVQDYQQGRKTANAFGQTAFGAPAQPSGGIFGQPAAPATGTTGFGGFGAAANPTTTNTNTGFGGFGQPASQTAPGGGLFGGTGAFGQATQQPQQTTAFGGFGQPQPSQQSGTTGGLFGSNQPKPGFGATTTGFGTGGAFGQTPQQQQPAAGGLFGQQTQNTGNAFGGFGQNTNAPKPSLFGPSQPATGGFGFGTQTQPQQQQQQQPAGGLFGGGNTGGGLFGQNTQPQQTPQAGGLFGTQQPQQQTGGLFGSNTGGGLFGNTGQQQQPLGQQPQQPQSSSFGTGLFGGPKPAAPVTQPNGGLFGGFNQTSNTLGVPPAQQSGGLFASTLGAPPQNTQPAGAFSGGLFGNRPAAPTMGMSQSTAQQGGSLFGNTLGQPNPLLAGSMLGQGQQGTLTASVAQPISPNLPIFEMLPPGPRSVALDQQPKKKPGYFVDVPTRATGPRLQLTYAPSGTKLRGFGSTSTPPNTGSSTLGSSSSLLYSTGKPNALSLSKAPSKSLLAPDAFLTNGRASPSLGSGGRQSVKKLTLDKKVDAADLFSKSIAPSFNPALSIAAREKEAAASNARNGRSESPTPARSHPSKGNRFGPQGSAETLETPRDSPVRSNKEPVEPKEGEYWVKPSLDTLKSVGHEELLSFEGLVVGRVGFGQITFLEPVDLTNLPKLASLLGEVVKFDDKECSVYPDADDADKPPPGTGLNVRSRIELFNCWAVDRSTRQPIKDEKNPLAVKHVKRLRGMKHTQFESFDWETGTWTFTVDHF